MKNTNKLEMTALIERESEGYYNVWLCHDNPQDHPDNHSFVAGSFDTFDGAVQALLDVKGIRIHPILVGTKNADGPDPVDVADFQAYSDDMGNKN